MADLSYDVQVNTSQAERSLSNLQKSVGGLNDTFIRLKSTLATISLGAIITQAVRFADTVQDLADATDLSTASIIGFGNAVAQNGGSVDGAQKGIAKLIAEIDDAANSAGASREAFRDVGVSLNDLRTKSTQDIFKQVITGLAGIDDSATKSRLAAILLNKEMRGVNFKGVGADFGGSTASAEKYASATQAAAAANDKLAAAVATFQLKLIAVLEPINKFISSIDPKAIEIFIDRLINIVQALAGLYVINKVTSLIVGFTQALNLARLAQTSLFTNLAKSSGAFGMMAEGVLLAKTAIGSGSAVTTAAGASVLTLGARVGLALGAFLRFIPIIGTAILAFQVLDGVLEALTGKNILEWAQQAAKGLGLIKMTSGEADKAAADHLANMKEIEAENQKVRDAVVRGQEAMAKFRGEVAKANLESKQNLQIQGQSLSNLGFRLGFEKSLIGLTEDQKEIEKQRFDIEMQRIDKQDEYARAVKKLQQEQSLTKDVEANKLIGARIGILQAEAKESDALYGRQKAGILDQLMGLQKVRMIDAARLQDNENIIKAIESQIERQQKLGDILRGINDKKVDISFEGSLKGLTPLQKEIAKINEEARKAAMEAGRSFSASFDSEDGLTPERAQELANGLGAIAQGYRNIAQAQIEAVVGFDPLKNAFEDFKNNALDTGKQMADSFGNFTSGMEDAFVQFAQTGKLSFKSLANSIIADLIRIAVRRAIVAAIGGPLGSLFGMANGGSAMAGTPYMVGERGPELFVPSSAGKIVPNNVLSGSAAGQGAVNGGGQTVVNYNIQAVDASSFRSLVAKDPSFIYAVTEQGRRSQPTRTR